MHRFLVRPFFAISLVCLIGVSLLYAATIYQVKQTPPIQLGTSGGNVLDRSSAYCCSGTLGALVTKGGGTQYILSNNHVLARSGQGSAGDDISQPGMVDSNCSVANSNIVADLTDMAGLGTSNVDAAIAQVRNGMVDPSGAILTIGVPASSTVAPAINMGVAKSGRTTGFTCAAIGSVNTSVTVQYETQCGGGSTFNVTYRNQVVINNNKFSAGGDSGSLIVNSATAQPVGLLFAGSSTSTIANPIGDVKSALGISFVGSGTHAVPCSTKGRKPGPKNAAIAQASQAKERHADSLMLDEAVLGVGVGADDVNSSEAVIVVYVEQGREHRAIPSHIDGVKTKIVTTDRIRAFGWNEPHGRTCKHR